jgi:Bacterial archaeo-eukaryotic release factor family 5
MSAVPDTLDAVDPLQIVRLRDPHGVLSVYVDADPREQASRRPAWVVAAENGLDGVRARVKAEGDRARWTAVKDALASLQPQLDALLDPRRPGRGRALFATIAGGDVRTVTLQVPLVDRVALDDMADVTPLLVALDRGRPAGLVVVSHSAVRVLERRLGAVDELATFEVEPDTSDWRETKGPAAGSPTLAQHGAAERDRFERRLDEHTTRLVEGTADELDRLRARRNWDRIVLAGDPRLTKALEHELDSDHVDIVVVDRTLNGLSGKEIADALAPHLDAADARREERLVGRARDAALSGNAGALGLGDVLAALEESRVEHLLFDPARPYPGARAPDGRLVPEGVVPPGVEPADLAPEPSLAGHLIDRALTIDATVTPLSPVGAEALAEHGGIAALLRW